MSCHVCRLLNFHVRSHTCYKRARTSNPSAHLPLKGSWRDTTGHLWDKGHHQDAIRVPCLLLCAGHVDDNTAKPLLISHSLSPLSSPFSSSRSYSSFPLIPLPCLSVQFLSHCFPFLHALSHCLPFFVIILFNAHKQTGYPMLLIEYPNNFDGKQFDRMALCLGGWLYK